MFGRRVKVLLIALLAVVVGFVSLPASAGEGQPVMMQSMVQAMMGEGLGEQTAQRLALNNSFMAKMCVEQLEQECLQEKVQLQTREQLQLRENIEQRVGSAFGLALAASYSNQGEDKTFQAAMTVFSSIRRGLSPEGAATSVKALAENEYEVEQMYRVMMRITERLRNSANCDEECLMTQVREMAQQRLSVRTMEQKMDEQAKAGNGTGQSGSGGRSDQTGKNQEQGGSQGSQGGNSGGSENGQGGNSGNGGSGSSGEGGQGKGK